MCEHENGADDLLDIITICILQIVIALSPLRYIWLPCQAERSALHSQSLLLPSLPCLSLMLLPGILQRHTVWMLCWRFLSEKKRKHLTVSDSLQKPVSHGVTSNADVERQGCHQRLFEQHKVELVMLILNLWDKRWNLFITELSKIALNLNVGVCMCVWMCVLSLTNICYFPTDKHVWADMLRP